MSGSGREATADVLVIGAGGAGVTAAGYLAAAGVGRVGIVDGLAVQRADIGAALLHFPPDLGRNRAESLAAKLALLNTDVVVEPYPASVDAANAAALVIGRDAVVDCGEDPEASHFIREACAAANVPVLFEEGGRDAGPAAAGIHGAALAQRTLGLLASSPDPAATAPSEAT